MSLPEITIRVRSFGGSAIASVDSTIFPRQLSREEADKIKVKIERSE